MEHDEEVILISSAIFEINHIHNAVRFLKEIQGSFELFSLDKSIRAVVQLSHDDRDLILGHSQLFVVMLVEGVIVILCALRLLGSSIGFCC